MFLNRVTNPYGDDNWYGFHRSPGGPDTHRSWDRISSVASFERVHRAYDGNMNAILSEFNPAPRHIDSLLMKSLCCVLALGYHGEKDFLNELLVELGI